MQRQETRRQDIDEAELKWHVHACSVHHKAMGCALLMPWQSPEEDAKTRPQPQPQSQRDNEVSAEHTAATVHAVRQKEAQFVVQHIQAEIDSRLKHPKYTGLDMHIRDYALAQLMAKPYVRGHVTAWLKTEGFRMNVHPAGVSVVAEEDIGLASKFFTRLREFEAALVASGNARVLPDLQKLLHSWQLCTSSASWELLGVSADGSTLTMFVYVKVSPETWDNVFDFLRSKGYHGSLVTAPGCQDRIVVTTASAASRQPADSSTN